ncbi:hypothetical protein [Streptomyces sp. NPDC050416]
MSQTTDPAPVGTFPHPSWVDDLLNPALRSAVGALPAAESRVAG